MKSSLSLALIFIATFTHAEEAHVREIRSEGAPVFVESTTGTTGDGEVVSFSLFAVPTTVIYTRVSGDPLVRADMLSLRDRATQCDGPRVSDISQMVEPDKITFTFQCYKGE